MKVPEPRKLKSGTWFIQMRLGGESIPVSAPTRTECIKQNANILFYPRIFLSFLLILFSKSNIIALRYIE